MLCIFAKEESLNMLIGKYDYGTDIAVQREESFDMGRAQRANPAVPVKKRLKQQKISCNLGFLGKR